MFFTDVTQPLHSRWRLASLGSGGGSPGGPRRRSSVDVPKCSHGQGSIGAASGTTLGVLETSKMKENERFYGFTDFRGKPAGRGRGRRGPAESACFVSGFTPWRDRIVQNLRVPFLENG